MQSLKVSKEEGGQKLFNFLQRRLESSKSEIHKWIRSGQVRINGKRCTAFDKVLSDDEIRIPPFALFKTVPDLEQIDNKKKVQENNNIAKVSSFDFDSMKIYEDSDLLILNKPCDLAVQGGSKQNISLIDFLKINYKNSPFAPTPAHRLDKATSGLLLIAKSYTILQKLHLLLQDKESGNLKKIYRAQVIGKPKAGKWQDNMLLEQDKYGYEKIVINNSKNIDKQGQKVQEALSIVEIIDSNSKNSLLEIDLITGRKHQIRVQCSHRKCPILGDKKYGMLDMQDTVKRLYLHAYKIVLEGQEFIAEDSNFVKAFS